MTKAKWIWYPGDFELWLHARTMMRRDERGMYIPPIWKIDSYHPNVKFRKVVELERGETVAISANGRFNVMVNGRYQYDAKTSFELEAGMNDVVISIMNDQSLPTIYVAGATIRSDETWSASYQNNKWSDAASWIFDHPEEPPVTYRLATERISPNRSAADGPDACQLDFGRQTFGYVEHRGIEGRGSIRVYYGESEEEARSEEYCETFDIADITCETEYTFTLGRAFRYLRVRTDPGLSVRDIGALYEYLPLEYRGRYRGSDAVLNEIWDVSIRTLH